MRIATVLACLTLFGCEATPGSHSANSNKNTPIGVEVIRTDTKANNAGDDAGKDGTSNGSTDSGSNTAPIDTSTTEENPCKNLEDTAAGDWHLIKGQGTKGGDGTIMSMGFAQDEQGGCAFTTNGDGAFSKGATYHVAKGAKWPQKITKDGWEVNFVIEGGILTNSVIEFCCTSLMANLYSR